MGKTLHLEPAALSTHSEHSALVEKLVEEVSAVTGVERLYPSTGAVEDTLRSVGSAVGSAVQDAANTASSQTPEPTASTVSQMASSLAESASSLVDTAIDLVSKPSPPAGDVAAGAAQYSAKAALTITARLGLATDANVAQVLRRVAATIRKHTADDETLIELEAVNA